MKHLATRIAIIAAILLPVAFNFGCLPYERDETFRNKPDVRYRSRFMDTFEQGAVYVLQQDARLDISKFAAQGSYPCRRLRAQLAMSDPKETAIVSAGTRIRFEGYFVHQQPWSGEGGSCLSGRLLDGPYAGTRVNLLDQSIDVPGGSYRLTAWLK